MIMHYLQAMQQRKDAESLEADGNAQVVSLKTTDRGPAIPVGRIEADTSGPTTCAPRTNPPFTRRRAPSVSAQARGS